MRLIAPFVLLAAVLWGALALDDTPPPADLVLVNRGEVFTLDPQRMSWMQDFRMGYALYEGLLRWDNSTFTPVPAACELPEVSDDGLTYRFRIREGSRWSDGSPLTAHDFVYAWKRALLPDTAADYSNMFFLLRNGREFFDFRAAQLANHARNHAGDLEATEKAWREADAFFRDNVGAKALDDRTLEVRLAKPCAYFLDLVCFVPWHPVQRRCVEGADDWSADVLPRGRWASLDPASGRLQQRHDWTKPGWLVGNGPYVLTRWRYLRDMRLERNPHFRDPAMAKSDSIQCLSIEDNNTAVLAFESGRIDWLSEVSVEYLPDMAAQTASGQRKNLHLSRTFGTDFYSFNCRPQLADGSPNPFHNPAVRRAFVLSVDRAVIGRDVTRLNEPVVTTIVPPGSIPGYESPQGLGYDPDRARRELREAGWEDRNGDELVEDSAGKPFPTIDLLYGTNRARFREISLVLRDMWQRELGVRVELRGKDNKFFKEDLIRGNFMIGRGNWYGDYGDPTTFLDIFRTGDGNNDRGYSSPRIDQLLDQAAAERDPTKRFAILSECERILFAEEVPMLVFCNLVQPYMYDADKLRGITRHPRLVQYLWQMEAVK